MKSLHIFLAILAISTGWLVAESDFETAFPEFIDQYCVKCHGPDKQKGDRRFDRLSLPIEDSATLIELQNMLDILNLGEMPPEDEDKRPDVEVLLKMIESLTQTI